MSNVIFLAKACPASRRRLSPGARLCGCVFRSLPHPPSARSREHRPPGRSNASHSLRRGGFGDSSPSSPPPAVLAATAANAAAASSCASLAVRGSGLDATGSLASTRGGDRGSTSPPPTTFSSASCSTRPVAAVVTSETAAASGSEADFVEEVGAAAAAARGSRADPSLLP